MPQQVKLFMIHKVDVCSIIVASSEDGSKLEGKTVLNFVVMFNSC